MHHNVAFLHIGSHNIIMLHTVPFHLVSQISKGQLTWLAPLSIAIQNVFSKQLCKAEMTQ